MSHKGKDCHTKNQKNNKSKLSTKEKRKIKQKEVIFLESRIGKNAKANC